MTPVTTFTQAPDTLTPTELNSIQDDYEALGHKRALLHNFRTTNATGSGARIIGPVDVGATYGVTSSSFAVGAITCSPLFYYDPSMWLHSNPARKPRVLLRATLFKGSTATGQTSQIDLVSLNPDTTGGSGIPPTMFISTVHATLNFTVGTDANLLTKQSAVLDASIWTPGLYAILNTRVGVLTGNGYAITGQVVGFTS